ncbi:MAG: hypothetical protein KJ621_10870 [Proteobacteria bacterium]|nr:hypothetical protein [Pseudomonadota bacterium]
MDLQARLIGLLLVAVVLFFLIKFLFPVIGALAGLLIGIFKFMGRSLPM